VINKCPAIGSILEHGSPLKLEEGTLEIGFPAGSYFLSSFKEAESIDEVRALANEFYGRETKVRVTAITPATDSAPPSLAEKKKSDREQRREELMQEVAEHPLINEALRIFGGKITDVRED